MPFLPDEELTDLLPGDLKIIQARTGYRFSVDPVLLCRFAGHGPVSTVIDLGSGSGIIPLLLARQDRAARIVALERQPGMVDRARRSVALNGLSARIEIIEADVRHLPESLGAQTFDVVLTNPPYRSIGSGRVSADDERASARHEVAGNYADFIRAATFLLKNGGRFYIIYLAERLAGLLAEMRCLRLEPKRLRMVHARQGQEAKLVLVEGRKNGKPGLKVESPLIIYKGKGRDYTDEVLSMYQ